jgi:hypothetical protein
MLNISIHILNGLGTRGVMLVHGKALFDYIENEIPLIEIDIKIFPKKSKGKLLLLLGHSTNI